MQRFASLLDSGLRRAGHDVQVVRPPVVAGKLVTRSEAAKWLGYVDKLALFPLTLKRAIQWAEIIHVCDHANSLYVKYLRERPHVVTCHDLFAIRSALGQLPQYKTRWSGRRLQSMILNGLTRAQHTVCVSAATRRDLLRITSLPDARVSLIYNGLNYPYAPMAQQEAESRLRKLGMSAGQRFILHVGGNCWYKNRLGVFGIFSLVRKRFQPADLKLVMVGKPWTREMRQFARQNHLEQHVIELVQTHEEDLRALYSTAAVMLFPSLAEGFGWPIIEAQACGCPVVTSNRAPMTEVGGEAAIYIEPEDPGSAAEKVAELLRCNGNLINLGSRNAGRFTASSMIERYSALYDHLVAEHSCRQLSTV
jgi:glycosyltransferase involved in cell wall biosynthesis